MAPQEQTMIPNSDPIPGETPESGLDDFANLDYTNIDLLPQELDNLQGAPLEEPEPNRGTPGQTEEQKIQQQRYEFWQSKHDKVRRQLDEVQPYMRYVEALKYRPDLRGTIDAQLQGAPLAGSPPVAAQSPALVEPTSPKRPRNYDVTEAFQNPDSESFKYRAELEEFRDAKIDFLDQRDKFRQLALTQAMEAVATERAREQQLSKTRTDLAMRGITGTTADGFLEWATNPEISLQDLVDLYRVRTGTTPTTQSPVPLQDQAAAAVAARKRAAVPPSLASSGGQSEVPENLSDDQKMSQAFLGWGKRL